MWVLCLSCSQLSFDCACCVYVRLLVGRVGTSADVSTLEMTGPWSVGTHRVQIQHTLLYSCVRVVCIIYMHSTIFCIWHSCQSLQMCWFTVLMFVCITGLYTCVLPASSQTATDSGASRSMCRIPACVANSLLHVAIPVRLWCTAWQLWLQTQTRVNEKSL